MVKNIFLGAVAALLLSAVAAQAVPITTPPLGLTAVGDVTAVYVFADANDTSVLNEVTPLAVNSIFCNHPEGGCAGNMAGDTVDLTSQTGPMVFSLNNLTTPNTFFSNAVASDNDYHVLVSTDYSVYNEGALPGAAATAINNLIAGGQSITYVGFEDRIGGDYDYNDLIFAFANTVPTQSVPEPVTISLFGMGLAGAAFIGRRKNKKA